MWQLMAWMVIVGAILTSTAAGLMIAGMHVERFDVGLAAAGLALIIGAFMMIEFVNHLA